MTDLVAQLVGALEAATTELESHQGNPYCNLDDLPEFKAAIAQARAALSAAKDGGWVAVPQVPTREMVDAMAKAAHDTDEPANKFYRVLYAAMLAARPLPNPPKGEV